MKNRNNRAKALILAATVMLAVIGCGVQESQQDPATLTKETGEMSDEAATVAEDVQGTNSAADGAAVVALSKSIGDLWLLAGGTLTGGTEDVFELAGVAEDLPTVGRISQPSAAAIIALNPDLVLIAPDIPGQRDARTTLEAAGINCKDVDVNSFADYDVLMKEFTEQTGRADLYEQNVTEVQKAIDEIMATAPASLRDETFLVMKASASKTKILKDDHFVVAMLEDLGLQNAAPESLLNNLSMEGITEANPDYIFVISQGKQSEAAKAFEDSVSSQPAWAALQAVQNNHVITLDKDLFQYKPNARWAEAYEELLELTTN